MLTAPHGRMVFLLLILFLLFTGSPDKAAERNQKRPNILIISCEDISPYLGSYGDTIAISPNLDGLAGEGIRFTNAYSVSGVCSPTRSTLITGMYQTAIGSHHHRTSTSGLPDGVTYYEAMPPAGVKCYTEFFRAAGYYCTNNAKTDYQFTPPLTAWDESSKEAHWKNRPDEDTPFFAIFNYNETHEHKLWANDHKPLLVDPDDVTVPPYLPDTPVIRRDIARVYTNIAEMDLLAGERIREVRDAGLLDETIIIFYSDHGGPLPRGKRAVLDSGLRVPMIFRFPDGQGAGTVNNELVSFVDVPPTLLALAHLDIPGYMQGQVFLGEKKDEPREYIFAARDRMDKLTDTRRAVRDMRFKFIRNYRTDIGAYQHLDYPLQIPSMREMLRLRDEGKLDEDEMRWFRTTKEPVEFYDTRNDPHELRNAVNDPQYAARVLEMSLALDDWIARTDDKGLIPEKAYVQSIYEGGVQPVTENPVFSVEEGRVVITSSTPGASIAYQVNGSGMNKEHWYLYTGPFNVEPGDTVTGIADRIGYRTSATVQHIAGG